MEKLEFSMQDLGRLAAFMENKFSSPTDLIKEWVWLYSGSAVEAADLSKKIQDGYEEEKAMQAADSWRQ